MATHGEIKRFRNLDSLLSLAVSLDSRAPSYAVNKWIPPAHDETRVPFRACLCSLFFFHASHTRVHDLIEQILTGGKEGRIVRANSFSSSLSFNGWFLFNPYIFIDRIFFILYISKFQAFDRYSYTFFFFRFNYIFLFISILVILDR